MSRIFPLVGAQMDAADPVANVWLSASAGTGKTQVLSARVFRLLLRGDTEPENILCLTYTKAGAAEMAERINNTLARWVLLDEEALKQDLQAIGASRDNATRSAARKLFAKLLDAPGPGLRIMTIHSFCQQLLGGFPAEAGLVPGFEPMEGREEAELSRAALSELSLRAEAEGDEKLIASLQSLSYAMGEGDAEAFLLKCAKAPVAMEKVPATAEDRLRWAYMLLGCEVEGDTRDWLAERCVDGAFDGGLLDAYVECCRDWGTKTALDRLALISSWRSLDPEARAAGLQDVQRAWAVKDGSKILTLHKKDSSGQELAQQLLDWSGPLLAQVTLADYAARLAEAMRAGKAYAAQYAEMKRARGLVDFDDLVREAARLLKRPGIGQWIAYKLDQRIDHILVDESQDTNKAQWDIVTALTDEFFAGIGASEDKVRTLFTVGDFKQAIFGFQGTSPKNYASAHEKFAERADAIGRPFAPLDMARSFRSTEPVLAAVDAMIETAGNAAFGLPDGKVTHATERGASGQVCLALPFTVDEYEDSDAGEEGWISEPKRLYAEYIAKGIAALIASPPWLATKGKEGGYLEPGDIMVLLCSRGELASLIVARLYAEGVPVAGVDRLSLSEPLGILDLMAAVRFVLQPGDDLNLASLLVSPLIGWDQDRLLIASDRRPGETLWSRVKGDKSFADAATPLLDLLNRADFGTPYQFLEHILSGPMQGRQRLIRRLGQEVRDPIDALLTAAQSFETQNAPSLQRFVDWMDRGDTEIKREGQGHANEVRVMTVHGSKGLQAPYVILVDMTRDPKKSGQRQLSYRGTDSLTGEEYEQPLLHAKKDERSGMLADIAAVQEEADLQENMRLLYVAMTRAEEHLVMAGVQPMRNGKPLKLPDESWQEKVAPAMQALTGEMTEHPIWGMAYVHGEAGKVGGVKDRPHDRDRQSSPDHEEDLPQWLHALAPEEQRPPRPLAPSNAGEDENGDAPATAALLAAAQRGKLLHSLFERLPDVAVAGREKAALGWLRNQAPGMTEADRQAMADDVMAVLSHPDWATLFGPDSLAETPIAAVVGDITISGKVDRLLISDDEIFVVDFKTGRNVPADAGAVPTAYLKQMAWYMAALGKIYPGRNIRSALLYSSEPRLIELRQDDIAPYLPVSAD